MLCQRCSRMGITTAEIARCMFCSKAACPGSLGELALRAAQIPQIACRCVPGGRTDHRFSPSSTRRTRHGHVLAGAGCVWYPPI